MRYVNTYRTGILQLIPTQVCHGETTFHCCVQTHMRYLQPFQIILSNVYILYYGLASCRYHILLIASFNYIPQHTCSNLHSWKDVIWLCSST